MTSSAALTIRHATIADEPVLQRLAALDSSRVPSGELLVAELDGAGAVGGGEGGDHHDRVQGYGPAHYDGLNYVRFDLVDDDI